MFNCKNNEFMVIVVYKHPKDFPHDYVARAQYTDHKTKTVRTDRECIACHEYEDLYDLLRNEGYVKVSRFEDDDPAILETWL